MLAFNTAQYNEVKRVLDKHAGAIPDSIHGPDRVSYLAERMSLISSNELSMMVHFLNHLLHLMVEREASDIEVGGYATKGNIWMRIYGTKKPIDDVAKLSYDESSLLILCLINEGQRSRLMLYRNLDFSYTFCLPGTDKNIRFRADAYFDLDTLGLNMRAISVKLRTIDEIGFHPAVLKVFNHQFVKQGLILITGITGSGKSTTLDAIVDLHNNVDPSHIVIIASPVEFVHESKKALIRHREVGRDVLSFKEGVIQSLRQDPDIIVIGEMRDPDTILAALEVTDTGHKVFSTLHTSSAVESIDRIIAEVNPHEQERVRNRLADVLTAVVSQKLVPSLDGKRVLAKEVLVVNANVRAAIKNNNTSEIYMMINQASAMGMITMEQDLKRLYELKKISLDNAISFANNKVRMKQILGLAQ